MNYLIHLSSIIFIITMDFVSGYPSSDVLQEIRPGYMDSLNQVITIVRKHKIPSAELTEYIIPETSKEAILFFDLDYKKESTTEFRQLLQQINEVCINGKESAIMKFITLSQFVDGYFAED